MTLRIVFASIVAVAALAPTVGFAGGNISGNNVWTGTVQSAVRGCEGCAGDAGDAQGGGIVHTTDIGAFEKACATKGGTVERQSDKAVCNDPATGLAIGLQLQW